MRPQVSDEGLQTINKLLSTEIEKSKPMVGVPELEAGTRIMCPTKLQIEEELWEFDFIVEYAMAKAPKDSNQGFTMEDFHRQVYVQVYKILAEPENGKPRRYIGEVIPLEDFYGIFKTDNVARLRIDRVIEIMDGLVKPSENFFMKINEVWTSRSPGDNPFRRTVYRC